MCSRQHIPLGGLSLGRTRTSLLPIKCCLGLSPLRLALGPVDPILHDFFYCSSNLWVQHQPPPTRHRTPCSSTTTSQFGSGGTVTSATAISALPRRRRKRPHPHPLTGNTVIITCCLHTDRNARRYNISCTHPAASGGTNAQHAITCCGRGGGRVQVTGTITRVNYDAGY